MNLDSPLPERLKAGSPGLGQANQTGIERRAGELARSDGRNAFTDADLALAVTELAGGVATPGAPEADPSVEQLTAWDDPLDQCGHRVGSTPMQNEGNIGEQLIQNGLEEADHDIRVAASDDMREKAGT